MVKILFLADLHLTNRNTKFLHDDLGVSDLLRRQYQLIKHISENLLDQYDYFVFLGDWTDHETLDPITCYYSNKCLSKLVNNVGENATRKIFLEGNHCIDDEDSRFTVLSAAEAAFEGNRFSDSTTHFVYQRKKLEFSDIIFEVFPYHPDSRALEKMIEETSNYYLENRPDSKAVVMLFHFPTSNALLDNKMAAKKGVHLSDEITKGFDICVGGDYHTHQKLIGNDRAYYAGAPFDLKNGEHQPRRMMTLDIRSGDGYSGEEVGEYDIGYLPNPFAVPILRFEADEIRKMTVQERQDALTGAVLSVTNYEDDIAELLEGIDVYKINRSYIRKGVNNDLAEEAFLVEKNDSRDFANFVLQDDAVKKHEKVLEQILKRAGI